MFPSFEGEDRRFGPFIGRDQPLLLGRADGQEDDSTSSSSYHHKPVPRSSSYHRKPVPLIASQDSAYYCLEQLFWLLLKPEPKEMDVSWKKYDCVYLDLGRQGVGMFPKSRDKSNLRLTYSKVMSRYVTWICVSCIMIFVFRIWMGYKYNLKENKSKKKMFLLLLFILPTKKNASSLQPYI